MGKLIQKICKLTHRIKTILMHKLILLLLTTIVVSSCNKNENIIPDVRVNFSIQASEVGGVGSAIYTQDIYGVRGIIIYHKNTNEYVAFERACTFRPSDECAVIQLDNETNPSYLVDNCCNSRFILDDGTPFSEPALLPLKQYLTTFDGNYINVTN